MLMREHAGNGVFDFYRLPPMKENRSQLADLRVAHSDKLVDSTQPLTSKVTLSSGKRRHLTLPYKIESNLKQTVIHVRQEIGIVTGPSRGIGAGLVKCAADA